MKRLRTYGSFCAFLFLACLQEPEHDQHELPPLNPKLQQVLYWGANDPQFEEFNAGAPNGSLHDISYPVWASNDRFFVYSSHFYENRFIVGIYEILIDPATDRYVSSTIYEFERRVWSMSEDRGDRTLLVITSDLGNRISRLELNAGLRESIEVDADWNPWGCSDWPGQPGLVFFGVDPVTRIAGFYWCRPDLPNLLLLPASLSSREARGMAISCDGRYLFYGTGDLRQVSFFKHDLLTPGAQPIAIASRSGGMPVVIPNPQDVSLVLINYAFGGDAVNPPQCHIELLNLDDLSSLDLDVRTKRSGSLFTINDHPSWNPSGTQFIFSAGAFSGEGDHFPMEIWLYKDLVAR